MTQYDCDRALRVPLDGRLWLGLLWLASLTLLSIDTLDLRFGIAGAWALLLAVAGAAWTGVVLHAYSRRVVLEVMSYEHQQQHLSSRDNLLPLSGRR